MVTRIGNNQDNVLRGSGGADTLEGRGGDDRLIGRNGRDILNGGDGDDLIEAGRGRDVIQVIGGGDSVDGGGGVDVMTFPGAPEGLRLYQSNPDLGADWHRGLSFTNVEIIKATRFDDTIFVGEIGATRGMTLNGGGGSDSLTGGLNDDVLKGGAGADGMAGSSGDDVLKGGGGDDFLQGDDGDDRLVGGTGNDGLVGGEGDDLLFGGGGRDRVLGTEGDDTLTGGKGGDTFVFTGFQTETATVTDFKARQGDLILIQDNAVFRGSYQSLLDATSNTPNGARIELDDNSEVFLEGIRKAQFESSWFEIY